MKKQLQLGKRYLILLVFIPFLSNAQYCTPGYNYHCTLNNYEMFFNSFSTTGGVTNITNNNQACGNASTSYIFYSKHKHAGIQGKKVNFSYTMGKNYPKGVKIWVDYNGDGDYTDVGEKVWSPTGTHAAGSTIKGSFTVPADAPPGVTRLRIRCCYNTVNFTDCNNQNYGEAEDYVFEVVPSCSAKFTTDPQNTQACQTGDVLFHVAGTLSDSFSWEGSYDGGNNWIPLGDDLNHSGTGTDSLYIKNLTLGMHGFQYRALAFNKNEVCTVKSKPADLVMVPTTKSSIVVAPNPGDAVCDNTQVIMYSSWTNGGPTPQYQWMVNGQDVQDATEGTYTTDSLRNNDIVECRFMSSNICVYPEVSNKVTFEVNDMMEPVVEVSVMDNEDNSYTFTANPTHGGSNAKYQWYKNNTIIKGETGSSYTTSNITPTDKIVVEMYSSEKCIHPDFRRVSSGIATTVGIANKDFVFKNITLQPNPNNGQFIITGKFATITNEKAIAITISNSLGQTIYNNVHHTNGSNVNLPITLESDIANGLYILNITVDNQTTNMQFVINR